jgi:hypothetical protein
MWWAIAGSGFWQVYSRLSIHCHNSPARRLGKRKNYRRCPVQLMEVDRPLSTVLSRSVREPRNGGFGHVT